MERAPTAVLPRCEIIESLTEHQVPTLLKWVHGTEGVGWGKSVPWDTVDYVSKYLFIFVFCDIIYRLFLNLTNCVHLYSFTRSGTTLAVIGFPSS